jgi:dinuclear metal center YbgI/SA1388 family protein
MTRETAMLVRDITAHLQRFAPLSLAESWDNVGLLLGSPEAPVKKLMTCLTVTPESVAEAVAEKADLIVSHHPILYKAVQRLTTATPEGKILLSLLAANVAVYSPHTAFDNCQGGINDLLCRKLALTNVVPMKEVPGGKQLKVVVFVPDNDLAKVSEAMFAAGAGVIGQYEQCSYRLSGIGTFFGTEGTNPTLGQKGRREEVSEWRLEVVCPVNRLAAVLTAMRGSHSYEEPAFDIYPLEPQPLKGIGIGRVGDLPQTEGLADFSQHVGQALTAMVQTVGDPKRSVKRVAIICGAGGSMVDDATKAKADVFLTGEMRFHEQLAAQAQGLAVVLAGHYATERPGVEMLAEQLKQEFPALEVWASRQEQVPTVMHFFA